MTEQEWLNGTDLTAFAAFLGEKCSERKRRLFACACCRRIWHLMTDGRSRSAVEVAERYADGDATARELTVARSNARKAREEKPRGPTRSFAETAAWHATFLDGEMTLAQFRTYWFRTAAGNARYAISDEVEGKGVEEIEQLVLLRDIFGNPFHPSSPLPEGVLAWNDATVLRIAEGIYEERAFDRLPILADALIDAGCEQEELIGHFRSEGPHVRGCWGVDLILGRS